jgi:hypothetical protein
MSNIHELASQLGENSNAILELIDIKTEDDMDKILSRLDSIRNDLNIRMDNIQREVAGLNDQQQASMEIKIQQLMLKQDRHLLYILIAVCIAIIFNNWESILTRLVGG